MAKCISFVCKWWVNKETKTFCWDIPPSSFGPPALFFLLCLGGIQQLVVKIKLQTSSAIDIPS